MGRRKGSKRATRGKLERALDQLDAFIDSDNYAATLDRADRVRLERAREYIAEIESAMYHAERKGADA